MISSTMRPDLFGKAAEVYDRMELVLRDRGFLRISRGRPGDTSETWARRAAPVEDIEWPELRVDVWLTGNLHDPLVAQVYWCYGLAWNPVGLRQVVDFANEWVSV